VSAAFTSEYATATNRLTMQMTATGTTGTIYNYTYVTAYGSVADFVDELAVNPPRILATSMTSMGSGATTTYSYDAQRQLISKTLTTSDFPPAVINYTAWDANGRPTAGGEVGQGFTIAITKAYDDAARTMTSTEKQTQAPLSPLMTYVQSYTADGEPLLATDSSNGTVFSTRTTTITSTAQVCK
jgi:hypothetical protein